MADKRPFTFFKYNPKLTAYAKQMRNNPTPAEKALWKHLKGDFMSKYDFHRQKPLGSFIADFFCKELMLIIEVDGAIHFTPEAQERDKEREEILKSKGLNILRFTNDQVLNNVSEVIEAIVAYVEDFERQENTPRK